MLVLAAPVAGAGSGIRGRVTAGPTCPVETNPPQPGCAPRGFKARVVVSRNGHVVKRLTSGVDGRFSVLLPPARYRVRAFPASGRMLPRCPSAARVTVRRGAYTRVAIACDSGIR